MAITSFGYKGTINEVQWAQMSPYISAARYGIVGESDLNGSIVATADRTVRVGTGTAWGNGVMDILDTAVDIQLPIVESGTRWDTIVLRRSWLESPGTTIVTSVQGNETATIAGTRKRGPGDVDDQPLFLVRLVAGQQRPVEIIDLRCWASNGGAQIMSEAAFGYLAEPGSTVWYKWRMYVYMQNESGTWAWDKIADFGTRGNIPLSKLGGDWVVQGTVHATQDPPHRINNISAQIYRTGGSFTLSDTRWTAVGYLLPDQFLMPREPYTGETVQVFPAMLRTVGTATSFTSKYEPIMVYLDIRDGTFRIQAVNAPFTVPSAGRIFINFTWNVPFDAA